MPTKQPRLTDDEDTEGQGGKMKGLDDDDTEGHGGVKQPRAVGDDEDTEGMGGVKQPRAIEDEEGVGPSENSKFR